MAMWKEKRKNDFFLYLTYSLNACPFFLRQKAIICKHLLSCLDKWPLYANKKRKGDYFLYLIYSLNMCPFFFRKKGYYLQINIQLGEFFPHQTTKPTQTHGFGAPIMHHFFLKKMKFQTNLIYFLKITKQASIIKAPNVRKEKKNSLFLFLLCWLKLSIFPTFHFFIFLLNTNLHFPSK